MKTFTRTRPLTFLCCAALALLCAPGIVHSATFTVTTAVDQLDNPSGIEVSLREALRDAAAAAGADTIVFSQSIVSAIHILGDHITVNDAAGVTIDASAAPKAVTIDGGPDFNRIFRITSGASLTLHNLVLTGGDGGGPSDGRGGAISNAGTLTMTRCTLTRNTASLFGGAIDNTQTLIMQDCTLSANSSANHGGAIHSSSTSFIDPGSIFLQRCTLSGNTADNLGGGIMTTDSGTLTQCTLSGNSARIGGGIFQSDNVNGIRTLQLEHCTVVGNQASFQGGGISASEDIMTLAHCLISGNTAPAGKGAGLFLGGTFGFGVSVKNCIIAGNTSTDVDRTPSSTALTSQGNNRIGDGNAVSGFNVAGDILGAGDPLVAPLADNGGPTRTHAILPGSYARDISVTSTVTSDQRGFAIFGPPDIGAYELWVGNFSLDATDYPVFEGQNATVTISVPPGQTGPVSVRLFTVAGTATAADFTARPNTTASDIVFIEGETTKVVQIPITADTTTEGAHVFTVKLGSPAPAGVTSLGTPNTATVTISDSFAVTNTNDAGAGSLRQALTDAAAAPGAQVIGFVPALSGQLITFASEIVIADTGGVTIDGSSLPEAVNLSGGAATRLINVISNVANVTLRRLTFSRGNGTGQAPSALGGAIRASGVMTLEQCTFASNAAGNDGGALSSFGTLTARQCTFSGNTATDDGGAIHHSGGIMTLVQCTFSNNSAQEAGAIHTSTNLTTQSATLRHCTLVGNFATVRGGAILNRAGRTTLEHCLVTGNTAPANGGAGVGSNGNTTTDTVVTNCIIANNATTDVDLTLTTTTNSFTSQGNNFIGDGNATADFNVAGDTLGAGDPFLDPTLANNGGPTKTHALLNATLAYDATVGSTSTTDQRGFVVVNAPDIGAFEVQRGGSFKMKVATATATEGGLLLLQVQRLGGFSGAATVRVFTVPGSATAADFATRPNTAASDITFVDRETTKNILIPITADGISEGNHSFTVSLGSPSPAPAATLDAPLSTVVTIRDSLVVTNTNDDGPGSLRQAATTAGFLVDPTAITFAPALNGKTITLGSEIVIFTTADLTIDASSLPAGLTIDGGPGDNRIFSCNIPTSTLQLTGLTLTGGNSNGLGAGPGGAVFVNGSANLTRCTLFNNSATFRGGALCVDNGFLTMTQCTVSGNSSPDGGGVAAHGGAKFVHCTIVGNSSSGTGGGLSLFGNAFVIEHCIISGNTAPGFFGAGVFSNTFPFTVGVRSSIIAGNFGNDLEFGGGNPYKSVGFNRVGDGTGAAAFNAFSDVTGEGDPQLGPLASNGGPGPTHALLFGSPAINATVLSTVTRDQRGVPVVGIPDIGAFEAQNAFSLNASSFIVPEGSPVQVVVRRTGDLSQPAHVRLITIVGSAGAAEFTSRPNTTASQVNFDAGESESQPISIATAGGDLTEPNETFTVALSSPSPGSVLAAPSSAPVILVDPQAGLPANDGSFASATFTFPAQNALVDVPVGGFLTATGTATDNKGVSQVAVSIGPNAVFGVAPLAAPGAATTGWTHTFIPATGKNTLTLAVRDTQNNNKVLTTTRTFTVRRPLAINVSGFGSVTPGFAPTSFRVVGSPQTVTATAGTGAVGIGALFSHWSVLSTHTLQDLGISAAALEKATITFIHREGLALRANFLLNPYFGTNIGTFNGGIKPSATLPDRAPLGLASPNDGTSAGLGTDGYASFTVQSTGGFSGTLKIDGLTLPVSGSFDPLGVARFGTTRSRTLTVLRGSKPPFSLSLTIGIGPFFGKITGFLSQTEGLTITAVSEVDANRAAFSTTNRVPATAFGATTDRPATGLYTMSMQVSDARGLSSDKVPGGACRGTATLGTNGVISVVCLLSEGTPLTMSTTISQFGEWRLFAQLYPGLQGYFSSSIGIDHTQNNTDFQQVTETNWVRPVLDRQHYPMGWQDPIRMGLIGARYVVTSGESVVPLTEDIGTGNGNATLFFSDGLLSSAFSKNADISDADAVTEVPSDDEYTLAINRATGLFSGTFRHADGTTVPYSGIVYQKGLNTSAGFFLTTTPNPKDYTGQAGVVFLIPQ